MIKLDDDKEKPKKSFWRFKWLFRNFLNKFLNKFFDNEEIKEESQQEYIANLKLNDINKAKFKALKEYKTSNKKQALLYFIFYLAQILALFIEFIFCYFIEILLYYRNLGKFT